MDLSDPQNLKAYSDPIEMPVSELLTGDFHFVIPSYQRGYRWESSIGPNDNEVRQVDDLLNDLTHFVDANANNKANYYLQPLIVKPRYENSQLVWDVLDGQQRLTSLLLLLKCLNENLCQNKFPLYTISYTNRPDINFDKITFDPNSPDHDYPKPNKNLDGFFVRKAKDRIEEWFKNEIGNIAYFQRQQKFMDALITPDKTRVPVSNPSLRVLFIWYNAHPLTNVSPKSTNQSADIAIFNRLNGGKISLTNAELLKALFLLCVKKAGGTCIVDEETLVRKWDEMERKFQDNEFWNMICPKNRVYENRLDFLFDFIRESDPKSGTNNSYRYYYNDMKSMLTVPDSPKLEQKWEDIKHHFDTLCKWHENTTLHNYIGYLIEFGKSVAYISKKINAKKATCPSSIEIVKKIIRDEIVNTNKNDVVDLRYHGDESKIRKILMLFNVEVSEKHSERFSFNQYNNRKYDIEHVNSQTDNAIVKPQERLDWINDQALASLNDDNANMTSKHPDYQTVSDLINEGKNLKSQGISMSQNDFNNYRTKVENYYANGRGTPKYEKDWIGNLTLLNSSINREYQNALFPQKLRTIKRNDQEGEYIPSCTRYLFLKYYSEIKGSTSAFNMMRWRDEDQEGYCNAIINTLKDFLQ